METKSVKSTAESKLFQNLEKSKESAIKSTYIDTVRGYIKSATRNVILLTADVVLLYWAWNYQLYEVFNCKQINIIQTLIFILVIRILFPIGSFTSTLQALQQNIKGSTPINKPK